MPVDLSIRVPWHDTQWNGTVCRNPATNCHCTDYENILKKKQVAVELPLVGQHFEDLGKAVPPCADEAGGFLSSRPFTVSHTHPYKEITSVAATHAHLEETSWTLEPFTAQGVPFRWMNRNNVASWVEPKVLKPLPDDDPTPEGFNTNWVFGPALQEAILDAFFAEVVPGRSLAVFYTKGAHPIGDDIPRLVVGIGEVTRCGAQRYYESSKPSARKHPIWQRDVGHSLRPGGVGGLLVPFHEYLEPTGDPTEDRRRHALAQRLVIGPDSDRLLEFSYRTEWISPDSTISVLTQAIQVAHLLRSDGLVEGAWEAAERWLNERLGHAWRLRGPHPGLGPVLEAMGLRLGTSLVHHMASIDSTFADDPWAAVGEVLEGRAAPPSPRFLPDVEAFRSLWQDLRSDAEKMRLARALSRLALDATQAKRWWDPKRRKNAAHADVSDADISDNPYVISELDLGGRDSAPVSFSTVDRAVLEGTGVGSVISPTDRRRRRAAAVDVLRRGEREGDTLLGEDELRVKVERIPVPEPVEIPDRWLSAEAKFVEERVTLRAGPPATVQLNARTSLADILRRKLAARAKRSIPSLGEDWRDLLSRTVRATSADPSGGDFDDERMRVALDEQARALEVVTTRKLGVLVGRAGTGKTTVLGALSRAPSQQGRVLFLAPTGKARVRLESRVQPGTDVRTVAQFLYQQKRYDSARQSPLVVSAPCYSGHETVVIDESSMLTEDDLAAVISTFTGQVKRILLVGDTAQLPPIGPGRPFADLVAHLDPPTLAADDDEDDLKLRRGALARLRREVRTVEGARSDALTLAGWFTGDDVSPDAESIFTDLTDPTSPLNDLSVRFWDNPGDLHSALEEVLQTHLNIKARDLASFNESFLMEPYKRGWVPNNPAGAERWQILSPLRRDVWGCNDLNKWVQTSWRGRALERCRRFRQTFGPQEIIKHDKVILLKNDEREGYNRTTKEEFEAYLANGEVALIRTEFSTQKNLLFAGRPADHTFGFKRWEFGGEGGSGLVELAYALTVHKAQGSEFAVVIVVLPKGRMAYRELIYTALTRSREKLVLLVQGGGVADLIELSKPAASETIRRNSNIFRVAVREGDERPFAHHLVHRAADGTLLRSKSELLIYSRCADAGLRPQYEERWEAQDGTWKWPDFTFVDDAGDRIVWEHLGMLDDPGYRSAWEEKKKWYLREGLIPEETLFWTEERGGLDVAAIDSVITKIRQVVG